MTQLVLTELTIYPIKSAAGIAVPEATVEARGLKGDRRWLVVDATNTFITQRKVAKMALISVTQVPDGLIINAPGMEPLAVSVPEGDRSPVRIWRDTCDAISAGRAAEQWFSQFLNLPCRLGYMPEDSVRPVNFDYAIDPSQNQVSFADSLPFLLISEASLADLNRRLDSPIPMDRFRPNLVVAGCEPFAEDRWRRIQIGSLIFYGVKPCDRCIIPSIDQATGEKGKEPLPTLAKYRLKDGKIFFGQNMIAATFGTLKVGDKVEVLQEADIRY